MWVVAGLFALLLIGIGVLPLTHCMVIAEPFSLYCYIDDGDLAPEGFSVDAMRYPQPPNHYYSLRVRSWYWVVVHNKTR
jgi:hypothetical protein